MNEPQEHRAAVADLRASSQTLVSMMAAITSADLGYLNPQEQAELDVLADQAMRLLDDVEQILQGDVSSSANLIHAVSASARLAHQLRARLIDSAVAATHVPDHP
ncbi:hypothetical protein [Streptomyces sp. H39-S7]|uniref:hypothetical protein n=1 Tax=Streptomyces sp. H39-S7 TaxID=3004357 RepID=UPI0022B01BAB|nr:hypothetical protein [Streptomyces sp. H39-S7]MCZ4120277.1 hypothetical protein [Streptomyces sp. H39-S7]